MKALKIKDFKDVGGCSKTTNWWSWGESNYIKYTN
jgi:hypothetical protein